MDLSFVKKLLIGALVFFILSFLIVSSNDFSQDLGRHIAIGKIITETKSIPKTNLFSFTNPSYLFINHHWLSEVVFYGIYSMFGGLGLQIIKIACIGVALYIIYNFKFKIYNFKSVFLSYLICVPLLLDRIHIRPEIFGYVFFSILLVYLLNKKQFHALDYLGIFLIMMLWVNMHISFVFGIFVVGLIGIKIVIDKQFKSLFLLFASAISGLLLNPHGLFGVLYPFLIFRNYGYMIVENQSVVYLIQHLSNPFLILFLAASPLVVIALSLFFIKRNYIEALVLAVFFLATIFQWRHLPFFVLSCLAIFPIVIKSILTHVRPLHEIILAAAGFAVIFLLFTASMLFVTNAWYTLYENGNTFGFDVSQKEKHGVDFLLKNNVSPNVFNNFDIGGYLIYRLYPKYQVFVDNRPESYPADFFEHIYIPIQLDESVQTKYFKKYNIHTIIYSHTDGTDWSKIFLARIYRSIKWKLLYLDEKVVIFSDESKLRDNRDSTILEERIKRMNNSHDLIYLSRFFSIVNETKLATMTLQKAYDLNPSSCVLKKIFTPQLTPWYCL